MARVTVEDCIEKTEGVFSLIKLASQRARRIANGAQTLLENEENDKPTVLALREIAEGHLDDPEFHKTESDIEKELFLYVTLGFMKLGIIKVTFSNLTQSKHCWFVIFFIFKKCLSTVGNSSGSLRSQFYKAENTFGFLYAVFYSYSGHVNL